MDVMDLRSKMGSTLVLAVGAVLGACVMIYVTKRRRRKTPDDTESNRDALFSLQAELDEYRKSLEELHQRLEHETERRNESEAWSRKLESDLMDHVSARKHAEEKYFKMAADLEETKRQLKESIKHRGELELEVIDLKTIRTNNVPADITNMTDTKNISVDHVPPPPHPPPPTQLNQSCTVIKREEEGVKTSDVTSEVLNTLGEVMKGNDDIINDGIIGTLHVKLLDEETDKHLKDQYEEDEDYEVYPDDDDDDDEDDLSDDFDDEEEDGEGGGGVEMGASDDHFELGKDVMGALIANAFKDGVIASREGDESASGDTSDPARASNQRHVNHSQNGEATQDKGEVSQESFDVKTTRRFWEQMIASDRHHDDDDDTDDDDVYDEDDDEISDDEDEDDLEDDDLDDLTEEEMNETNERTSISNHHPTTLHISQHPNLHPPPNTTQGSTECNGKVPPQNNNTKHVVEETEVLIECTADGSVSTSS